MASERSWTIGSDPLCDLVVAEQVVSGRHCRLTQRNGRFWLEDLGSTNGTYVNQVRISQAVEVRPADIVTLGRMTMMPWPDTSQSWMQPRAAAPRKTEMMAVPVELAASLPNSVAARSQHSWPLIVGVGLVVALALAAAGWSLLEWRGQHASQPTDMNELAAFDQHTAAVRALDVSADGKTAVSGGDESIVSVWNVETRRQLGKLVGHRGGVNAVALSLDGKLAATGGDDSTVRIWNLDTYEQQAVLDGHDKPISAVAFYPAGTHVLSAGRDGRIVLWHLIDEKPVREYTLARGEVTCLTLASDTTRFITGDSTGWLRVWELASDEQLDQFRGHEGAVNGIAASSIGNRLLSCGEDGQVRLWALDSKRTLENFRTNTQDSSVTAVAFSPGGTRALVGNQAGEVSLWSCEDGQRLESYAGHAKAVDCCAIISGGSVALTGSVDHSILLWKMPLPSNLERDNMHAAADKLKLRIDGYQRFASQMQIARQALAEERYETALDEFRTAERGVEEGSLEHAVAHQAAIDVDAGIKKREKYVSLCKAGKEAADRKEYQDAMQRFQEAHELLPDRKEAQEGFDKASNAYNLKTALDDASFVSDIGFAVDAPTHNALEKGHEFAYLLVRKDPPMGPLDAPVAWTITVLTTVEFPDVPLKLRVQIKQAKGDAVIAQVDHPFVKGTRRQIFQGEGPPPRGGWVAGHYDLHTSLVRDDEVKPQGEPTRFGVGLIRWTEKKTSITPKAVSEADFAVKSGLKLERGDALKVTADGQVTPTDTPFYRELLEDKDLAAPVVAKPSGIAWKRTNPKMKKYHLLDTKSSYGALLVRVGTQSWIQYRDDLPPQLSPIAGDVELAINSVVKGPSTASADFWRADGGSFDVTLLHGKFDFPDEVPALYRAALLRRFEK